MRFLVTLFCVFFCLNVNGQDSTLYVNLSLTLSGASGPTPFWMHANKNGSIPIEKYFASGQWGGYKMYNPNDPRLFQWSGGMELITNYSKKGDVFFTDLYVASKLGPVEFLVGQKKNIVSLVDSTLGTGSLSVSGNSRPIPRFQVAISQFQPLGFTNDFVSIKGSISEGYLGSSQIVYGSVSQIPSTYFHQKQIYFRLGKNRSPVKVYLGINHQAIWGGEDKIAPVESTTMLKSYWHVLTGKSFNQRKVGINFGTTDLAAEFKINKIKIFAYRNNIHENGSLFKMINIADGLNGITFTRSDRFVRDKKTFSLNSLNLEYLALSDQKNQFKQSELVIYQIADYYNNYIYQRGWSNYGLGIGSPMVPPSTITDKDLPKKETQFTNNNRIQAFHTALKGSFLGADLTFKGTYSRNSGTYINPFFADKNQVSLFISGEKPVRMLHATVIAGVASDIGKLYPNSVAVFLGIRKSAFLN